MKSGKLFDIHHITLNDVVRTKMIGKVGVHHEEGCIEQQLGQPDQIEKQYTKKLRITSYRYGNITFLIERGYVVQIVLNYHDPCSEKLSLGIFQEWMLTEWIDFAKSNNWTVKYVGDVVHVLGDDIHINLSAKGSLEFLTLT